MAKMANDEHLYLLHTRNTREDHDSMEIHFPIPFPILLKIHLFEPVSIQASSSTTEIAEGSDKKELMEYANLNGKSSGTRLKCVRCDSSFALGLSTPLDEAAVKRFHCKNCICVTTPDIALEIGEWNSLKEQKKIHQSNPELETHTNEKCAKKYNRRQVNSEKYTTRQALKAHQQTNINPQPFKCSECGKGFAYANACAYSLTVQKRTHENSRPYQCEICDICFKNFKDHKGVRVNQISHSSTLAYVCPICQKTFKYWQGLKAHLKFTHPWARVFKCEICAKGFKRPTDLKAHKRAVHN